MRLPQWEDAARGDAGGAAEARHVEESERGEGDVRA